MSETEVATQATAPAGTPEAASEPLTKDVLTQVVKEMVSEAYRNNQRYADSSVAQVRKEVQATIQPIAEALQAMRTSATFASLTDGEKLDLLAKQVLTPQATQQPRFTGYQAVNVMDSEYLDILLDNLGEGIDKKELDWGTDVEPGDVKTGFKRLTASLSKAQKKQLDKLLAAKDAEHEAAIAKLRADAGLDKVNTSGPSAPSRKAQLGASSSPIDKIKAGLEEARRKQKS